MPTYTTYYNLARPDVNSPTDEDLWGGELNDNMDIIDSTLHTLATSTPAGVPSGVVAPFAGSSAPSGWQLCYGQAINRTTYASLFSVIGTTYGAGNGSTTFNLPDLRGRAVAGKDNMGGTSASRITTAGSGLDGSTLGAAGGSQTHTLTIAQIPSHSHNLTTTDSIGTFAAGGRPVGNTPGTATGTNTGNVSNTGSGNAHNNVQPTMILNYIIKE